jgi:hypothetical protein
MSDMSFGILPEGEDCSFNKETAISSAHHELLTNSQALVMPESGGVV